MLGQEQGQADFSGLGEIRYPCIGRYRAHRKQRESTCENGSADCTCVIPAHAILRWAMT
jgi:hypothetical protein